VPEHLRTTPMEGRDASSDLDGNGAVALDGEIRT
jgi:hypothetical protein